MSRIDELVQQHTQERAKLPGGLQGLIRGDESTQKDNRKTAVKSQVGTTVHTSLAIDNDLFVRLKTAAVAQGNRTIREVLEEAIAMWLKKNS